MGLCALTTLHQQLVPPWFQRPLSWLLQRTSCPSNVCRRWLPLLRVIAKGPNYIDIDRPLPIELRPAWTVGVGQKSRDRCCLQLNQDFRLSCRAVPLARLAQPAPCQPRLTCALPAARHRTICIHGDRERAGALHGSVQVRHI